MSSCKRAQGAALFTHSFLLSIHPMVKRDKNAHQSNHYKATHNSGGKSNKKSGGKGKKGNKSINQFLQIGKPGPHLLKHRQQQQAKKEKRASRNNTKPKKEPQEHHRQQQHLFSLPSYQQAISPPQTQTQHSNMTRNKNNKNNKNIMHSGMHSGTYQPINGVFEPMPDVTRQMRYPGHRNVNQSPYNLRATSYENHAGEPGKVWVSDEKHEPIHDLRQRRPSHQPSHTNNSNSQDNYEQDIKYKYEDRDVPGAPVPGPSNTPKRERKPKWTSAEKKERKEANKVKEEETEAQRILTPQEETEKKKKKKAKKQKAREQKKAAKEEKKQLRKDVKMAKGRKTGPGLNPYVDPEKQTKIRESFIDQLMADMEDKTRLQAAGTTSSINQEDQDLPKPSYQTTEGGDAMKDGADFIQFVESDAEEENTPVPTSHNTTSVQDTTNDIIIPETTAGHKRKRDGYGSDTEGSTGPPPGCPWMGHRQYSKLDSVPRMLTQELKDFVDFISPSREEHKIRQYVHRRIQRTVERLWPDAQVIVFGSFETRLYLPSRYVERFSFILGGFPLHAMVTRDEIKVSDCLFFFICYS